MANELMALDANRWAAAKKMVAIVSQVPGFKYFKKPHEAMLVAMKAHDMNLSFTEAMEHVFVVNNKTATDGAIMLKKIYEAGHTIAFIEMTPKKVLVDAKRKDQEKPTSWSYTIEEAERAGLTKKDNWRAYPTDMLMWRCVARCARFMFPDVLGGAAHIPEELGIDTEKDVTNFTPPEDNKSDVTDTFLGEETVEPFDDKQPNEANTGTV